MVEERLEIAALERRPLCNERRCRLGQAIRSADFHSPTFFCGCLDNRARKRPIPPTLRRHHPPRGLVDMREVHEVLGLANACGLEKPCEVDVFWPPKVYVLCRTRAPPLPQALFPDRV